MSTVEHLMAAFAGLGVDNVLVEIDGPEVPIMDGSAAAFVAAIDKVGLAQLSAPRRYIKILKPVRVEHGRSFSELRPAASGFRLDVEIDYSGHGDRLVSARRWILRRRVSAARLPGRARSARSAMSSGSGSWVSRSARRSRIRSRVDGDRVLNPEGLRSRTSLSP